MAVKHRDLEAVLKRADLTADRRLAEINASSAWVKLPALRTA